VTSASPDERQDDPKFPAVSQPIPRPADSPALPGRVPGGVAKSKSRSKSKPKPKPKAATQPTAVSVAPADADIRVPSEPERFAPPREQGAVSPTRRLRRHRRDADLPGLPAADFPEDAAGRVTFVAITPPPDMLPGTAFDEFDDDAVIEVAEPLGPVVTAITALTRPPARLLMRGGIAGWAPIGVLAIIFVVVFVVGMRLAK